jgi:octaprenyl-diphosphate synthase
MIALATQNGLFAIVARELAAVEECLRAPAAERGALLSTVAHYALGSGGKRLRPALLLLSARACGGESGDGAARSIRLASAAEMMHAASLLHDDVLDHAATRRGQPSAMARWGSDVSVLAGDFLYARAIQDLVADQDRRILRTFADAAVAMTEAEVLQLQRLHDVQITEGEYLSIVTGKTAALISAACRAGALVAGASDSVAAQLADFGLHLGIGFQLVDDALDYSAREDRVGKPVGSDFREGKVTFPILHVRRVATAGHRRLLEELATCTDPGPEDLQVLRDLVDQYGAVSATMQLVAEYLARARAELAGLPESPACQALHRVVDFVRERDS